MIQYLHNFQQPHREQNMTDSKEKTFDEMSFQQKRELIMMYEDKIGIIFEGKHLKKIFQDIRDDTFTEFSYNRKDGYVDSHDAGFLIDFLILRIMGELSPGMASSREEKNKFTHRLHNKVSKPNWYNNLYSCGGLEGAEPAKDQ